MFSYTKKEIFCFTLVVTILFFCIIYTIFTFINSNVFAISKQEVTNEESITNNEPIILDQNQIVIESSSDNKEVTSESQNKMWEIEIPQINLKAQIKDGTTQEIMKKYVGHFENTSKFEGNIGLASHNRGGVGDYFKNIKNLKNGDLIIYRLGEKTRTYKVTIVTIIGDKDWSYLEKSQENKITLITCVEDRPKHRRCVQGIETNGGI